MNGYANVSFKSVDTTSGSAQNITADAEKTIRYAEAQQIPVQIKDMVASTVGIGPFTMEGLHKSSTNIVGTIPALGKTATVGGGKVTLTSPA